MAWQKPGDSLLPQGGILYGGDYNPEQWSPEVWEEDVVLMREAGVNLVTLGVFSWALLEPREGEYDFAWMDRVIDLLHRHGIAVDLATATAAHPAWASVAYPDMLVVDEYGQRASWGSRQSYCPTSEAYRRLSRALVARMVERYDSHPAVLMWHANNELACHYSACYCDHCAMEFRDWLRDRYGTVEEVNRAWGTRFWSQVYYQWDQIMPPRHTTSFKNPGQVLDYQRFMSDRIGGLLAGEAQTIRAGGSTKPITTNLMGIKHINYLDWARHLDVVSYDSYPDPQDPLAKFGTSVIYDAMRAIAGGKPWYLMEQAPNQVNWRLHNVPKKPGQMRLWSYQALAHGSDAVLYFQWRGSVRGAEKFHSSMIPPAGKDTRTFREIAALGAELPRLRGLEGSLCPASVGILFDYENWWAVEQHPRPSDRVGYAEQLALWHSVFQSAQVPTDLVPFRQEDLSAYKVLVAPVAYLMSADLAARLDAWVQGGGTLLVTFFSAWSDQEDCFHPGFAPGPLAATLGLRVAEYEPLPAGAALALDFPEGSPLAVSRDLHASRGGVAVAAAPAPTGASTASAATASPTGGMQADLMGGPAYPHGALWADQLGLEGATPLATYADDGHLGHRGGAAITRHGRGRGHAWYTATLPDPLTRQVLVGTLMREAGVEALVSCSSPLVEARLRVHPVSGESWLFLLNHGDTEASVTLPPGSWTRVLEASVPGVRGAVAGATLSIAPRGVEVYKG